MKWETRFADLAAHVAQWSKDPSSKVGCVLVNDRRQVISLGFNGFPRGVEDSAERLFDRPTKYRFVQHAEINALLTATEPTQGATAYVTHHPCANCAGALIQGGISRIVTTVPSEGIAERFGASFQAAETMLNEANVSLEFMK